MSQTISFMIIGAQKCGTTALTYFLSQHPQLCLSRPKEVHLFDGEAYDPDWDSDTINQLYSASLKPCTADQLCGEATPIYLYMPQIAQRIYRYNPDVKLLVMLRDPIERALSHYRMEHKLGNDNWPLLKAFLLEWYRLPEDKMNVNDDLRQYSYLDRGLYCQQLDNLYQYFSTDQVLLVPSESLWQQHDQTLSRVYQFLGVDTSIKVPPREKVFSGDPDDQQQHSSGWLADYVPISQKVRSAERKVTSTLPVWLRSYYRWKYRKEYTLLRELKETMG